MSEWLWPTLPKPSLVEPSLAKNHFGQLTRIGVSMFSANFHIWPPPHTPPPSSAGPPSAGSQNLAFFSLSRHNFLSFFFFSLLGVFAWNFGGARSARAMKCAHLEFSGCRKKSEILGGPAMCTFGSRAVVRSSRGPEAEILGGLAERGSGGGGSGGRGGNLGRTHENLEHTPHM